MRFAMFMIPGIYQGAEGAKIGKDFAPPAEAFEPMMKYNEELAKAGALIALDGLTPPSQAAQVTKRGGKTVVTDGPFAESKEVVGGYWLIRADSREEAIEWAKKVPLEPGDIVEVRQIFEMSDFPEEVQKAADNHPAVKEAIGR